jgi:hypothetical protein
VKNLIWLAPYASPIASLTNLFTFLLIPAALLGVPTSVIAITLPLHLFLQFWYHTKHIKKMGFLENILVTPSHHRVHHAINPEYLDKNHSQIFIFWDKIFGTFQAELDDVPPVFGITRPAHTWNPIKINFQHLALLIKDAWRAENWKDKLRSGLNQLAGVRKILKKNILFTKLRMFMILKNMERKTLKNLFLGQSLKY